LGLEAGITLLTCKNLKFTIRRRLKIEPRQLNYRIDFIIDPGLLYFVAENLVFPLSEL
jgi:hypothetical protein